jgi:hypothetical protein
MKNTPRLMTKTDILNYINSQPSNILYELYLHTDEYVKLSEVSKLGISRQRLHNWVKTGKVRTTPKGKQYMYSKSDIERLL